MACGKCKQLISNRKEVIKCEKCAKEFHVACCRVRTVAKLEGMTEKQIEEWRCEDCKPEVPAVTRPGLEDTAAMSILKSIQQEMLKNSKENKESFVALEITLKNISTTLDGVQTKLTTLEKENADLKVKCKELYNKNALLDKKVGSMQNEINEIQQYSRNRNIEVRGIPYSRNEDIYNVVRMVAQALGVNHANEDISIAHRLSRPTKNVLAPGIVIQFVSRYTRAVWLSAAKRKKIETTDLSPTLKQAPVYVNEHLTAHNRQLLGHAKTLVKEKKLAYAWVSDGKILVRKTADSQAVRVQDCEGANMVAAGPRTTTSEDNTAPDDTSPAYGGSNTTP
ncbi:hypothetical protein J6590_108489 [Homalodisca vitripennis]|nr:hypothetical protein J6590_108489 [Homalodisca vitripennis]